MHMRARRRAVRLAGALLGTTLAVAGWTAATQAQAPAARTAGQARPNLQVLIDIPEEDLIPTMRFVSAALGVECEFCHLGDRSLETDHKGTARGMMRMMLALNRSSFDGRVRVTCYTCHRGSSNPLSAPIPRGQYTEVGVGVIMKGNGNPDPRRRDEVLSDNLREYTRELAARLPPPETILAKYVDALGGEQALRRVTSRRVVASAELPADVRGVGPIVHALTEQYFKAPDKWVMTFQTASATTAKGFDGTVPWLQNAAGAVTEATSPAPALPLARYRRNIDLYEPLNLRQSYTRMATERVERVRDRDAYVVAGFPANDMPERLYFDTETGLLVRKWTATPTVLGEYSIQTDYEDYREVDGLQIPYLVRTIGISPGDNMTLYVEKVEHNLAVDDARFMKPAAK